MPTLLDSPQVAVKPFVGLNKESSPANEAEGKKKYKGFARGRISPDVSEKILAAHAAGKSYEEISKQFNRSVKTVEKAIANNSKEVPKPSPKKCNPKSAPSPIKRTQTQATNVEGTLRAMISEEVQKQLEEAIQRMLS